MMIDIYIPLDISAIRKSYRHKEKEGGEVLVELPTNQSSLSMDIRYSLPIIEYWKTGLRPLATMRYQRSMSLRGKKTADTKTYVYLLMTRQSRINIIPYSCSMKTTQI